MPPIINIEALTIYITIPSQPSPPDDVQLGDIIEGIGKMSKELDDLTREVSETGTVVDSAVTMIGGLAQQIRDLKNDPVALAALAAELDAKIAPLAEAVAANTPAEPSVEPPMDPPVA